jgi:hypothetical protein
VALSRAGNSVELCFLLVLAVVEMLVEGSDKKTGHEKWNVKLMVSLRRRVTKREGGAV